LLQLLQQPASESDAEIIAATVHAVSSMAPFIAAVENDSSNYSMLAHAAAAALQAGNRCAERLMSLPAHYAMFMTVHQMGMSCLCCCSCHGQVESAAMSLSNSMELRTGVLTVCSRLAATLSRLSCCLGQRLCCAGRNGRMLTALQCWQIQLAIC